MKTTTKILLAGVLLAASSAPLVASARVNVDVSIGLPVYVQPVARPVYFQPVARPVYYPPVARPVYYAPPPRAFVPHHGWERGWDRHHRFDDRRR